MKRILLLLLAVAVISPAVLASTKKKKTTAPAKKSVAAIDNSEVHWLTIDELQVKMKEHPKKVYIDIYTDWCGWCKRMEATTFKSPDFIKYMNENFYCVRLNAERKDTLRFAGRMYYFEPAQKANTLAVDLMHGTMSYPTSVIMEENFASATPIPGFQDVPTMEKIVKYFGENAYKTKQWPDYDKSFVPSWSQVQTQEPVPQAHGISPVVN